MIVHIDFGWALILIQLYPIFINNNSAIRWVGVEDKTYNIYASKNSNEKTTLVDTGQTVTPNNTQ